MSLIIYKPANKTIPESVLSKSFGSSDGVGFSFVLDGELGLRKTFTNFESFYKEFKKVELLPCLICFSDKDYPISTKKFCGLFKLDDEHIFAHIGDVFKTEDLLKQDESQSSNFLILFKKVWHKNYFKGSFLNWILENALSYNNRIVIMNKSGDAHIFGEKRGINFNGCWFSSNPYNSTYELEKQNKSLDSKEKSGMVNPAEYYKSEQHKEYKSGNWCSRCYTNIIGRPRTLTTTKKDDTDTGHPNRILVSQYCENCFSIVTNTIINDSTKTKNSILRSIIPDYQDGIVELFDLF